MITAFRWLLRLFTVMVVLSVVALLVIYYILGRSLPDYSAEFALSGISAPVEKSAITTMCRISLAKRMKMYTSPLALPMRKTGFGK